MKGLNSKKKKWESIEICLQVNLFQKHLLLHQLTHNLLSYCGLINIKIEASDKILSVLSNQKKQFGPIWKDIGWLCYLAGRLQNLNILIILVRKIYLNWKSIHLCSFIFQAKYFVYSWCDIENTVYCYTFEDIKTGCIMLDEFYSILL